VSIDLINPSPGRQRTSAVEMSVLARWAIFFALAAVCVAVIWLPFGFAMTGLIEEWAELSNMVRLGPTFFLDLARPMSDILRPLGHLPFALAYVFGPDSFVSWHILLMLALILKGCASSELVFRASGSLVVALIAGALVILYPADTMQFPFRALHINWSLTLGLLACCVFLAAWDRGSKSTTVRALGAAALLLSAALMYEAALVCLAVPFLLVVARDGMRGCLNELRRRLGLLLIWASAGVLYGVYAFWMSHKVATYQTTLLNGQGWIPALKNSLPKLFSVGMARAIYGGWLDAFKMLVSEYQSYVYLGVAALVLIGLVRIFASRHQETAPNPLRVLRLGCIGLAAVALGYSPYLLSISHVAVSQRTFLYASFGAVVFWCALLLALRLAASALFWCASSALLVLGLGAQLVQFHHYVGIAQEQKRLLRGIVENFDGSSENKTLIVIDHSGYLGQTWMFVPTNLRFALEYIYGRRLKRVSICHAQISEWEDIDRDGHKGSCEETSEAWVFRAAADSPIADWLVAKEDAVVLDIGVDGIVAPRLALQPHRTNLQSGQDVSARRYRAILVGSDWNLYASLFGDTRAHARYESSFGRWWSMTPPIRGFGWRGIEWDFTQPYPVTFSWKISTNAALFFDLAPIETDYSLRVDFSMFASEKIHDATKISLNGQDVECRWTTFYRCEARVAPGVLHAGVNQIGFTSPIDPDYYGLSVSLHSFGLAPMEQGTGK
jgi:hypothetical protein